MVAAAVAASCDATLSFGRFLRRLGLAQRLYLGHLTTSSRSLPGGLLPAVGHDGNYFNWFRSSTSPC